MKSSLYLSALVLAAIFFGTVANPASAEQYKIDAAHSFIHFKIMHLGYSWLVGRFNRFEGRINFDPSAGQERQNISLTIDAASVDTNHAERDKHLRNDDFFDVEKYPTITFESTGFDGDAAGGMLSGDLTLHGITKSISFAIRKLGEGKDPWGGYRAGFEGTYTLHRQDFGMGYNLGPAAEDVELTLMIEAIRQ